MVKKNTTTEARAIVLPKPWKKDVEVLVKDLVDPRRPGYKNLGRYISLPDIEQHAAVIRKVSQSLMEELLERITLSAANPETAVGQMRIVDGTRRIGGLKINFDRTGGKPETVTIEQLLDGKVVAIEDVKDYGRVLANIYVGLTGEQEAYLAQTANQNRRRSEKVDFYNRHREFWDNPMNADASEKEVLAAFGGLEGLKEYGFRNLRFTAEGRINNPEQILQTPERIFRRQPKFAGSAFLAYHAGEEGGVKQEKGDATFLAACWSAPGKKGEPPTGDVATAEKHGFHVDRDMTETELRSAFAEAGLESEYLGAWDALVLKRRTGRGPGAGILPKTKFTSLEDFFAPSIVGRTLLRMCQQKKAYTSDELPKPLLELAKWVEATAKAADKAGFAEKLARVQSVIEASKEALTATDGES